MRSYRSVAAAFLSGLVLVATAVAMTVASPATYVTPNLLVRGTYDEFKVTSNPADGGLFKAEAKSSIDVVVREHTYAAGGSTGWHAHPYPVLITVKEGTLTFYRYDAPTCTPVVVSAGQGYVDDGKGHLARNETAAQAVDVSVILAPVGAAFRTELSAPNPNCGF